MGKKCRVYRKLPTAGYGGDRIYNEGGSNPLVEDVMGRGMITQDSDFQPVGKKKTGEFLQKLDQFKQNFIEDEEVADQMAIMEAISKEVPEFKNGGWMQKARKSMKRKGTVGKFTEYCGGKVTNDCIERGLNSPNETVRKRAAFAKAARTVARNRSQWGGSVSPRESRDIPMAQTGVSYNPYQHMYNNPGMYGYANLDPGVWMKGSMTQEDPNAYAWRMHMENMDRKERRQLNDALTAGLYSAQSIFNMPDVYKFKGNQAIFDDPDINLDEFAITGYTPGRGGKTATLNYRAKGTGPQRLIEDRGYDWTGGQETPVTEELPEGYGPGSAFRSTDTTPGTTHGYMNQIENIGQQANPFAKFLPMLQDGNEVNPYDWQVPDQNIFGDTEVTGLNTTGYDWTGIGGQDRPMTNVPLMSEDPGAANAEYDIVMDQQAEKFDPQTQYETEGALTLEKQPLWETMMQESPYLLPTMLTQGMKAAELFAPDDGAEMAYRERISDPFNRFQTRGSNRGERGVNAWRIGEHLMPTEHTRKGFDTKIAQAGYEVGDELDLTPEEIQELIAAGYEIDVI